MNMQFRPGEQQGTEQVVKQAIADCDIHPQRKDPKGLYPYLEKRWRDHLDEYGALVYQGMVVGPLYPKGQPNASRRDAVPPEGGVQGSSLKFMQQQHLDPNNVTLGILCPLSLQGFRNLDLAARIGSRDQRLAGRRVVEPGQAPARVRGRRERGWRRLGEGNPQPRRRQEFRAGAADEPQHRAARAAPLLADLPGGGRGGPADRHPRVRQQRPSRSRRAAGRAITSRRWSATRSASSRRWRAWCWKACSSASRN